jgi:hypothetical protein
MQIKVRNMQSLLFTVGFKNEVGERCHLMPVVLVTDSGIMPANWMGRMIKWYDKIGITQGPDFRKASGQRARQSQFGYLIWSRLGQVAVEKPQLFLDKRIDICLMFST